MPSMANGMVLSCTVVGWVKPRSFTAAISSGAKPRVTKPLGASITSAAGASGASVMSSGSTLNSLDKFSADEISPAAKVASVMVFPQYESPASCAVAPWWLKNINHQTEPASASPECGCIEAGDLFEIKPQKAQISDPVNVGRCTYVFCCVQNSLRLCHEFGFLPKSTTKSN